MGVPIVGGRGFGEDDRAGGPQVMLINRTLARSAFFSGNPIGTQVYSLGRAPWEIVGIVEDVRQFGLDREPAPQIFIDARQAPVLAGDRSTYFAIRTDIKLASVAPRIPGIVRRLDSHATLDNVATMEQIVSNSISRPRFFAASLGIFAGIGLALAAIGIYGVMAYSVAQRTREIGIRRALGARRSHVIGLVLGQSAMSIGLGIALGVGSAAALTRYLEGMLFGLTPLDPATFVAVSLFFAAVATLAAWVPARRATNVDPMIALRAE
jgi:ABC-type antimicrobial peptide transport system permease subunit